MRSPAGQFSSDLGLKAVRKPIAFAPFEGLFHDRYENKRVTPHLSAAEATAPRTLLITSRRSRVAA
jgi:hypothetical protein